MLTHKQKRPDRLDYGSGKQLKTASDLDEILFNLDNNLDYNLDSGTQLDME